MQNAELFPFRDIELIPEPGINPIRHGWLKFVKRRPPIVYRGEYQMLSRLLERRGADLMHIYFGHTGDAFAAVHRALGQTVRGFIPRRGCGEENRTFAITPRSSENFSNRSRWFWRVHDRSRIDSLVWDARRRNCASIARDYPCRIFLTYDAKLRRMGTGVSCKRVG